MESEGNDEPLFIFFMHGHGARGVYKRSEEKCCSKYSLRVKKGWVGEDGYKWRKYGQKSIKNSPNPRSYYRCRNGRCSAKKQVERAAEEDGDEETYVVTYEGFHLHHFGRFVEEEEDDDPLGVKRFQRPNDDEAMVLPSSSRGGLLEDVVPLVVRNPTAVGESPSSCVS
ncbi:hypothetical protein M569_14736 [Genlisea aurea]|uniref:WRKY domain-containing protein n=1 Tax=Genlisea aurea TaxID=192259 RepID=S8C094_9LAMI|nr:hypothetical protein M569_14736 [Genlisea aurea]